MGTSSHGPVQRRRWPVDLSAGMWKIKHQSTPQPSVRAPCLPPSPHRDLNSLIPLTGISSRVFVTSTPHSHFYREICAPPSLLLLQYSILGQSRPPQLPCWSFCTSALSSPSHPQDRCRLEHQNICAPEGVLSPPRDGQPWVQLAALSCTGQTPL